MFQGAPRIITAFHYAPPVCDKTTLPDSPSSMDPSSGTKQVSTKFCCLGVLNIAL